MTVTAVTNRYNSRQVTRSCCRYRRYRALWAVTLVTLTLHVADNPVAMPRFLGEPARAERAYAFALYGTIIVIFGSFATLYVSDQLRVETAKVDPAGGTVARCNWFPLVIERNAIVDFVGVFENGFAPCPRLGNLIATDEMNAVFHFYRYRLSSGLQTKESCDDRRGPDTAQHVSTSLNVWRLA